ncbi:hypothetical protein [Phenylobacterium sp.]|uniref:hypothetical protein n=1 Tax=Phenylobacterium sp. TaxID=1871053 RepID=UPI0011FA09DA|nr:hypothetical protein [Phenylobacterium sp.]THD54141.1 MAG: hypothetical protein E8A12_17705 [Phenylobacterium sp.]
MSMAPCAEGLLDHSHSLVKFVHNYMIFLKFFVDEAPQPACITDILQATEFYWEIDAESPFHDFAHWPRLEAGPAIVAALACDAKLSVGWAQAVVGALAKKGLVRLERAEAVAGA